MLKYNILKKYVFKHKNNLKKIELLLNYFIFILK